MRKLLACFTLLLSVSLLLPAVSGRQQKKNAQKKDTVTKEDATPQDYAALAQVKDVVGKIADLDLNAGTMTFSVEWLHMVPNPNGNGKAGKQAQKALQLQQKVMSDYNNIMSTSNPVHQQHALAHFQQHLVQLQAAGNANLLSMFKTTKSTKDFEVNVVEKVKVARVKLEKKYNDEGELITYSADDIKKMKSPDLSNAYTASAEDLAIGQAVILYLLPPKKQAAKKTDSTVTKGADAKDSASGDGTDKLGSDAKDKTTSDAKDTLAATSPLADRPWVRIVLIGEETNVGIPQETPKKKKGG